jgi:hypothetical protein
LKLETPSDAIHHVSIISHQSLLVASIHSPHVDKETRSGWSYLTAISQQYKNDETPGSFINKKPAVCSTLLLVLQHDYQHAGICTTTCFSQQQQQQQQQHPKGKKSSIRLTSSKQEHSLFSQDGDDPKMSLIDSIFFLV